MVGMIFVPLKFAAESTMSRSMNSMDCGFRPASLIFGTVLMAPSMFSNGRMKLMSSCGLGSSFMVSSVMTPSVPSEPMIRCNRL